MTRILGLIICAAMMPQFAHAQFANSAAGTAGSDQDIRMPTAAADFKFAVLRPTPKGLEVTSARTVVEERVYVVSLNVDGVTVQEQRTRSVNVTVMEQLDPSTFNAYRLTENGRTEPLADALNRTTPAVIANALNNITPFMKQLLRPGTVVLVPRNDLPAPEAPPAPPAP